MNIIGSWVKRRFFFVITDDTKNCDETAAYLETRYPDLKGAVLTIQTKNNGEIVEASSGKKKQELDQLRKQANEIDGEGNSYKAIVSVIMLKEGWDVRNVTTIVGLRSYSAKSNILPEQTLGRRLRRMYAATGGGIPQCNRHRCFYGVCGIHSGRGGGSGARGDERRRFV